MIRPPSLAIIRPLVCQLFDVRNISKKDVRGQGQSSLSGQRAQSSFDLISKPADLDPFFLISWGVGFDIQDRCSFDHVHP